MVTTLTLTDRNPPDLTTQLDKQIVYAIDDEAINLQLLEVMFAGSGAILKLFDDGDSALEAIQDERPAIILLDVMMPGTDGWQTFSRIRKHEHLKTVPILFMTCLFSIHEERILNRKHARTRVLAKPFDRARLYRLMSELLDS